MAILGKRRRRRKEEPRDELCKESEVMLIKDNIQEDMENTPQKEQKRSEIRNGEDEDSGRESVTEKDGKVEDEQGASFEETRVGEESCKQQYVKRKRREREISYWTDGL